LFISPVNNYTLSPLAEFDIRVTAVINQTSPLSLSDQPVFSAVWSFTMDAKWDEMYTFETRYTFFKREQTIININLVNAVFFVTNVQQPIARQNEIIFRNLLFTVVILELFRLAFLIFQVICLPIYRWGGGYIKKKKSKSDSIVDDKSDIETNNTELNNGSINEGELFSKRNST
jgi:hypothetical protein